MFADRCSPLRWALLKGKMMAKGHECPSCGKNTLQPYTTNQLKCSNCDTIVKK
jgi:ribosomal protein L37AE/L43A